MSYTLRNATVKDAEVMDSMNRLCLPENYPLQEWKHILTMMRDVSTVMHNDEGHLLGYCLGVIYPFSEQGIIASVAVHPDYRGKGIGNKVVAACLDNMKKKGISSVTLNVRLSNITAQTLYKKLSFNKHRLIPTYYQDGEDAIEMKRIL